MGFLISQSFNALNVENANDFWSGRRGMKRYSWVFPSNLETVREVFSDKLPDIHALVYDHTRFNLYEPFLSEEEAERLYSYYISGRETLQQGVHTGSRYLARRAVCPDCVSEDIADFGYATWRRAHLAAGIVACAEHGNLLLDLCAACSRNFRRSASGGWMPKLRCECRGPRRRIRSPSSAQMDFEIGVAEMAGQLLRGEVLVNLDEWSIPLAIRNYVGSGSVASNSEKLKGILIDELGQEMMSDMCFSQGYIARLFGGDPLEPRPKNPIQNIAIARAVFGSWTALSEYIPIGNPMLECEHGLGRKESTVETKQVTKMNRNEFSNYLMGISEAAVREVKNANRLWLMEKIKMFPKITRKELKRRAWDRMNQIIDWDRGFIDELLPEVAVVSEFRARLKKERIRRLVARIYFLRDEFIRTDPCRRICKTHLTLNGGTATKSVDIAESEEVMAAFDDCIDTEETYLTRVAEHMSFLARQLRPKSSYGDESSWRDLSPAYVAMRIGVIKEWERKAGQ